MALNIEYKNNGEMCMKIETNNGILTIEFEEIKNNNKKIIDGEDMKTNKFGFVDEKIDEDINDDIYKDINNFCGSIKKSVITERMNYNRFNTGQVATTMSTLDRPDIDQIADIDNDIPGYDRIRVFDSMEKISDITIVNDGPDSLYFIVNRNGIDHEEEMWSQNEIMIYPGEAWKIYNVHELRIRSETQGNKYRITEDDVIALSTVRSVM